MRAYNGYKSEKRAQGFEPLPAGGYVLKIVDAKVEENSNGSESLVLAFDVAEGDYAGHFASAFRDDTRTDKKWRGTYRLFIPVGDGSEKDGWSVKTFNNFAACLEESNAGYSWDWNEKGLKGRIFGAAFRNKEWEYDGKTGWTTEIGYICSADDIRGGKFKMPADKPLANSPRQSGPVTMADFADADDDGDLPF